MAVDRDQAPAAPTGAAGAAVLDVSALRKQFGVTVALDGVTMSVAKGDSHALVGRNGAGKSTLVRCVAGLEQPDGGELRFGGQPAPPLHDRARWQRVVAVVHQRPSVVPSLTVAENLFLNSHPSARVGGLVSWRLLREQAEAALREWGLRVSAGALAGDLSIAQMQVVEIARALLRGSRFIILDEPTAKLEGKERHHLFDRMRELQGVGVSFLFISHHLNEVYEVCQTVTVLKDGRVTLDRPVAGLDRSELIGAMVGGSHATPGQRATGPAPTMPTRGQEAGDAVLSVEGLGSGTRFSDVSLTVGAGERVGLAGLESSGSHDLAAALCGLAGWDRGTVHVAGQPLAQGHPASSIRTGIGSVPRDRHHNGYVASLSIAENITMTTLDRMGSWGLSTPRTRMAHARRWVAELGIKVGSVADPPTTLSGGNQQKMVLARALASGPSVLVLVNPTAGVDVASRDELFAAIAASGASALVVSDDMEELRTCHRVLVMFRGRIVAEHAAGWDERRLIAAMEGVDDRLG